MSIRPVYIYNKDGDAVISPAIIHKSLMNMKVMSDHYSILQEALLECTDIEGVLLSESSFKQLLPHSVYNVNMPLSQKHSLFVKLMHYIAMIGTSVLIITARLFSVK